MSNFQSTGFYEKNIAGQVLTHNSTNFHRLNRKLDPERTMSELQKPFLKYAENQCQNAASKNKKRLARIVNLILTKN